MSERVEMRMERSIREYEQMRITKLFENDEIKWVETNRIMFKVPTPIALNKKIALHSTVLSSKNENSSNTNWPGRTKKSSII